MKLLMTGVRGNLASAIQRLLPQGAEVFGLHRDDRLSELSFDRNLDFVVHAAFDLKVKSSNHPVAFIENNVLLTSRLLEIASRSNVGRFVYVSSAAVYGNNVDTRENQPCAPTSAYGSCKLLNESLVRAFCEEHSIPFTIFRLFNLYGGDDRFSIVSRLIEALKKGCAFSLSNGGMARRDFIHVDDASRLMILILTSAATPPEICNIGSGRAVAVRDLLDIVVQRGFHLDVIDRKVEEVPSSCANTELLNRIVPGFEVGSVEEFLESALNDCVTRKETA